MGGARRSSSPRSTPACSGPACKRSIRIRCPRPRRPSGALSTPSMPPPKPLSPKPTSHRKLRHLCADSPETRQLVDLLIGLIHKINTRADRRVERELTEDLRRVRGKEGILFRLAEAAVEHPDD